MSFLLPTAFWAGLLVPVVVLLYFLKLKRQDRVVSSTLLWKRSIDDLSANAPFQRLRRNILLILQLLILAAAILALARPVLRADRLQGKHLIALLDNSASMRATDRRGSRLAKAKEAALEIVGSLSEDDRMMVISFASRAKVEASFTGAKDRLRRAIRSVQPTDERTNLRDAFLIASSLAQAKDEVAIYVFSDGCFEDPSDLSRGNAGVHFVKCGQGSRNVAITSLEARRSIETDHGHQIFATVENFDTEPTSVGVELYLADELIDARRVDIAPKGRASQVFRGPGLKEGRVRLQLDATDDLSADNQAWAVLTRAPQLDILLVSKGNYFLERALKLVGRVKLTTCSLDEYRANGARRPDVVIFDRCAPAALEPGNYLFMGAAPPIRGIETQGTAERPVIVDWDREHPTTRFVSFESLAVAKALKINLPGSAKTLVEADDTPLIAVVSDARRRLVYIGFDLYESNWPLKLSFPIFARNAMNWLVQDDLSSASIRTGECLVIQPGDQTGEVAVVDPTGAAHRVRVEARRGAAFGRTRHAGVYTARLPDKKQRSFAVNLLSSDESDIAPRESFELESKVVTSRGVVRARREIWPHVALAAVILLMVEWYMFNRRVWV